MWRGGLAKRAPGGLGLTIQPMSSPIVCKPTPWFLWRALAMLLMFAVFAVLFLFDGKTGYREKNYSYYVWKAVERASEEFTSREGAEDPEAWRQFARGQEIEFPEDRSILPERVEPPMAWPDKLADAEFMAAGQANPKKLLFVPLMDELGVRKKPGEKDYDARKIAEQWVFGAICGVLALGALFVLLRTQSRRLELADGVLKVPGSKPTPVSELNRLDLRKWKTKGLAFAWTGAGDGRKLRIDGLTYGGFKEEQGAPAERLMEALKAGFTGEIVDYEEEEEPAGDDAPAKP